MNTCTKCQIALVNDVCPKCDVYFGDECPTCGQAGYHKEGCEEMEGEVGELKIRLTKKQKEVLEQAAKHSEGRAYGIWSVLQTLADKGLLVRPNHNASLLWTISQAGRLAIAKTPK